MPVSRDIKTIVGFGRRYSINWSLFPKLPKYIDVTDDNDSASRREVLGMDPGFEALTSCSAWSDLGQARDYTAIAVLERSHRCQSSEVERKVLNFGAGV